MELNEKGKGKGKGNGKNNTDDLLRDDTKKSCTYNGTTYSHGSTVCQSNGIYYICEDGSWENAGMGSCNP